MKECSSRFIQSQNDFPCFVELGKNNPSFRINRWRNNALRFVPYDDEGFTLQGDKRRLLYKGRRRSHRFTILNDGEFEYDCILLKEPESNVISLRMEGAEYYDFFRQPDFVPDDFLKGSYAVYKKETLIGEGTGKLCHIHRPLIIDALGRKVWGSLEVDDNELRITIPEAWLSKAKYPVVVDPTIGTTTIGKQTYFEDFDDDLHFELSMAVNRFLVSDALNGSLCTGYYYPNSPDNYGGGRAILYSDNANSPLNKRSTNENLIDLRFIGNNKAGWRSGNFTVNNVNANSYIWFGLHSEEMWFPRYDYGAKCYWIMNDDYPEILNIFPLYSVNEYYDFKLSMYFTYTAVQTQSYVRTITQGVDITDSRKVNADYKRTLVQTNKITDERLLKADYKRENSENVSGIIGVKAAFHFFRECIDNFIVTDRFIKLQNFIRDVKDDVNINIFKRELNRFCDDNIDVSDVADRSHGFIRNIYDRIFYSDDFTVSVLIVRNIQDTLTVTYTFYQVREFIRCLYVEAVNIAETQRSGEFFRITKDNAFIDGSLFRRLSLFIKLVSTCFVRDFLLRRFLIAREEIILKSKITLELTLESKIN